MSHSSDHMNRSAANNMNLAAATTLMTLSVSLRCSRDFRYYRSTSPEKAGRKELIAICRQLQSNCYSLHNLMMRFHDEGSGLYDDENGPNDEGSGLSDDENDPNDEGSELSDDDCDSHDSDLGSPSLQPFLFLLGRSVHDHLETLHRELLFYHPENLAEIIPRIDRERRFWKNYPDAAFYNETLTNRLDQEIPVIFSEFENEIDTFQNG